VAGDFAAIEPAAGQAAAALEDLRSLYTQAPSLDLV
jgi:hypothetical protein